MRSTKIDCELQLLELNSALSGWRNEVPTVCLLAMDALDPTLDLAALVNGLVPAGCRYFMTWGAAADDVHDALDEILEERGGASLAVLTASHADESAEDVAWFMVHAALPGESKVRCCVGYDNATRNVDSLLKAVRAAVERCR